ncbi:response regulator [Derxia gummosa]|uniref:Response regulator n=1 Tax=Derxia gummosa DSM 723 TaxID=1121388 RepID=A0A8B6XBH1_9BURK|nr:response regulator [Derxia gummosa]
MSQVEHNQHNAIGSDEDHSGLKPAVYTVQLLGFNERERTLFGSIFALSKHRAIRYVEFNPDTHPHADYFIVDSEDEGAVESFFMIDPASCGGGLFVGAPNIDALRNYPVIARPIRWAEVILRIDALPRPSVSAASARFMAMEADPIDQKSNSQRQSTSHHLPPNSRLVPMGGTAATLTKAEDDLELSQISDWYDRSKITDFRTEPGVLVVDGDIASRRYMAAKLMDLNYRVDYAESAEQALQLLSNKRYNAIFIDPSTSNVDGYDLARSIKLRSDRRRIAIIFACDKPSAFERVRANVAGADAFLAKPFDQSKLTGALDKFLPNWKIKHIS